MMPLPVSLPTSHLYLPDGPSYTDSSPHSLRQMLLMFSRTSILFAIVCLLEPFLLIIPVLPALLLIYTASGVLSIVDFTNFTTFVGSVVCVSRTDDFSCVLSKVMPLLLLSNVPMLLSCLSKSIYVIVLHANSNFTPTTI